MSTKRTTFAEVIEACVDSRLADTYHSLPGIVQTYYAATQDADVQIALDDPRFDPDTDERSDEAWPIYPHMRVVWPRFGGFTICGPMSAGDKVQVFFQDLDDSNFRATGQQGSPPRTRRHSSDAAFCLPWDMTDGGVATDATAAGNALVMGKDGAAPQIRINGTTINLGRTGAFFVARADRVDAFIAALQTFATGQGATPITGTALAGAITTFLGTQPTTGSTLVKCD